MNVMFLNERIVQDAWKIIGDIDNDYNSYIAKKDYSVSWAKTIKTRFEILHDFHTKAIQTITKLAAGANAVYIENHSHNDIYSDDAAKLKLQIQEQKRLIEKYEVILNFHQWTEKDLAYNNADDWKEMKRQARINEVMNKYPELY